MKPIFEYNLLSTVRRKSNKLRRTEIQKTYDINHNFSEFLDLFSVENAIDNLYEQFVKSELKDRSPNDIFSAYIESDKLSKPIYICPRIVSRFNKEDFLDAIFTVCQSNKDFLLNGKFKMIISITHSITGTASERPAYPRTVEETSKAKKSVVSIKNNDKACGYLAIFLSIFYLKMESKADKDKWKRFITSQNIEFRREVSSWANRLQIDMRIPLSMQIVNVIQEKLGKDYSINIIDKFSRNRLYKGSHSARNQIYLEYEECKQNRRRWGHYNMI